MPHDLTPRRPQSALAAEPGRRRRRRFVVVRQRGIVRGRPGVVLIFVVVLLTLLAIMGTAYLATSRIDRQALTGRGALPGATSPLLADPTTLRKVGDAVEDGVKATLIKDLFNQPYNLRLGSTGFTGGAYSSFRQQVPQVVAGVAYPVTYYTNLDAPGRADPHLSSLLPARSPTPGYYVWPWIGRPLGTFLGGDPLVLGSETYAVENFFSDPRRVGTNGFSPNTLHRFGTFTPGAAPLAGPSPALSERNDVTIFRQGLLRADGPTPRPFGDNSRVYPAVIPGGRPIAAANILIAGDADGDGIADSGLAPIALNPALPTTTIDRYLDRANGVIYFASYRIVDNSAKLNLGTALTNYGDLSDLTIATSPNEWRDLAADRDSLAEIRSLLATTDPTATPPVIPAAGSGQYGPNYGFFRSNVGVIELLRTLLSPVNQTGDSSATPNDTEGYLPAQAEIRRFIDARFPRLRENPGPGYDAAAAGAGVLAGIDIEKVAMRFGSAAVARLGFEQDDAPPAAGTFMPYQYRSFGDLIEQQVARRPEAPGGYLWTESAAEPQLNGALEWFGFGDTASLAAKNGTLINPLVAAGTVEDALLFTARMSTPNVNSNGSTPWGWFPPGAVGLWFGWTQDFEPVTPATTPPSVIALDAQTAEERAFHYSIGALPNELGAAATPNVAESKPQGTADVFLPRSARGLMTTYSGTTTGAPQRGDQAVVGPVPAPTPGLPIGMPAYTFDGIRIVGGPLAVATSAYGSDPVAALPEDAFWYPPAKVSAATGTKEQLWRAYWSAMTQQYGFTQGGVRSSFWSVAKPIRTALTHPPTPATSEPNEFYDAFRSADRYATVENASSVDLNRPYLPAADKQTSDQGLSQRQMALIRSAVAACNTIDLRDSDNDITAMSVDITDDNTKTGANPAQARFYARVYGTEKQLVITGVHMEGATGFVAVEIYNPSDVPIDLRAYRLSVVTRTPGAATDGSDHKTTGSIAETGDPIRLGSLPADVLQPGGYVIVSTAAADPGITMTPASLIHPPTDGTPEVYHLYPPAPSPNAVALAALLAPGNNKELVLTRTRRADGVAFVDATATPSVVRNAVENEVLQTPAAATLPPLAEPDADTTTLVPVDSVDVRMEIGPAARYSYQRAIPAPLPAAPTGSDATPLAGASSAERLSAWRCFYAGKFYELRPPLSATQRVPLTPAANLGATDPLYPTSPYNGYAWRDLAAATTLVVFGPPAGRPVPITPVAHTEPGPLLAPAIPIQNFAPLDPYTATNVRVVDPAPAHANEVFGTAAAGFNALNKSIYHLLNRFPYRSPIARDADLLSVPYIGTYKIYRQTGPAAGDVDLYEFISLPMDAWIVAPDPIQVATVVAPRTTEVKTVGRFDPRFEIGAAPYHFYGVTNEWASSLTDFVSARQAPLKNYLPDVPDASVRTTFFDTTSNPTVVDQRYAQDGPVSGSIAALNTFNDVPWTAFVERDPALAPDGQLTTAGARPGLRRGQRPTPGIAEVTLTQGLINLNTAPTAVLRQLPWLVDPLTGHVNATAAADNRTLIGEVTTRRGTLANEAWDPAAEPYKTFGFPSLLGLNNDPAAVALKATTVGLTDQAQLMKLGMLNPVNRNEALNNYLNETLNIARVSNLATTRSDVYTVYVTVQAWTYVGSSGTSGTIDQARDTRLVGERRSSFVVDRSRISQSQYDVGDLIVLPIERE